MFGGMRSDGECNGDLYSLDMNTYEWSIVSFEGENSPDARDDHSICSSEDSFYVFAGFVKGKRMNDLHVYSFETKKWECLWELHEVNEFSSEEQQKECPCPRSGQDISYYNNHIYLFGGRNDFNDKLNDTWEFDISAKKWTQIECEDAPIGRSSHSVVIQSNRMILFGGIIEITKEINEIDMFDLNEKKWSTIDDKSDQHKYSTLTSPSKIKDKMNETAPVRSDSAMKNITMKRDKANQSMKKIHSKASLIEPDEKDPNFHLLKSIPKQKKKHTEKNKGDDFEQARNEIQTPITDQLRNTFVIKNQNEGFDKYYTQMKKRKGDSMKNKSNFMGMFNQCLKPCDRPTARDGHSCDVYKDRVYIFGGDRHHMPYNDTYSLDLS